MPGFCLLRLPLGGGGLASVNAYLVRGDDGFILIDCGWDTPEVRETLLHALREQGLDWPQLRSLIITHIHPDHYGLSGWIKEQAPQAEVVMHRVERVYVESRYRAAHMADLLDEMNAWLRSNGVPEAEAPELGRASMPVFDRVRPAMPDRLIGGGETLRCGDFAFTAHWTPGHANGMICLHEPNRRLFVAADHVLPRITPSITLHAQSTTNPLADYLDSLHAVRELDGEVDLVVAGHGDPFSGLAARIDDILRHHEARLAEMAAAVPSGSTGSTASEIAQAVRWRGGLGNWDKLSPFDRRLAVMETLAHLELLHARQRLRKRFADGLVRYVRV